MTHIRFAGQQWAQSGITALVAVVALWAGNAQAHNVWLEPEPDGAYLVQFGGHAGQLEEYPAAKLGKVTAYDRRGRKIDVVTTPGKDGVRVKPERQAAMIAAEFDNGFFSKTDTGPMVNQPMTENPGATSGVHAMKFHKTVIQWGVVARKELGQAFEIVATDSEPPYAGEPMTVKVLRDGKPVGGVRLSFGESGAPVMSKPDGTATLTPAKGRNQLMAIQRLPVVGDARTTSLSYEYLFAFQAH
jgi:nickel transport protein